MNVFYEEDGSFKVASVMTENPGSLQIEALSGKRSKIKTANVLLRFEGALAGFMESAHKEAETLETDFLWECCGEPEFGFEDLAQDYYGRKPSPIEAAAVALRLHEAPMYFYRKGKGRYKAAPQENLKAALAAVEKKRLQAEKIATYVEQLKAGQLPEDFTAKLDMLFYEPDKNTLEWKALDQAATELNISQLKLLEACGAIASAHDYHFGAFLREHFPGGVNFTEHEAVSVPDQLPQAEVEAFSIDDSTTTEIDDAFSIQQLADGTTRVGIHIAAPALGIAQGTALDNLVLKRLSTVYMPGNKITMLPESAIMPFSLAQGASRPALSLYLDVAPDLSIVNRHSKVEMVRIADNLRHDELEPYFNEATLDADSGHPYWARLLFLYQLAEALEKVRGKHDPSRPIQIDYNFYVENGRVSIIGRRRGSPMDKLVAELMIEANSHWGGLLAQHDIPGIYRAQNGGKVYMTMKAEPHQGLGVAQYAWSTSPLRRAVDLINQRQIISVVQNTEPAYPKNSEILTTAMRDFDLTYNAYNEFQTRMERYWCLQYLIQEEVKEISATVWRENLVRLDNMPYMTKVHSLPELASGTRVQLEIKRIDPLLMELDTRFKAAEDKSADVVAPEVVAGETEVKEAEA
ncbi:MAG TPA: RNB domain-containing ribonuclease [Methylophilaceae bacterium]|nr:RNB domain-containing ribonuclease [Methylophilaceae bacterium]